nr:ankyrin repeat protein [Pandoravirus massiliensis]
MPRTVAKRIRRAWCHIMSVPANVRHYVATSNKRPKIGFLLGLSLRDVSLSTTNASAGATAPPLFYCGCRMCCFCVMSLWHGASSRGQKPRGHTGPHAHTNLRLSRLAAAGCVGRPIASLQLRQSTIKGRKCAVPLCPSPPLLLVTMQAACNGVDIGALPNELLGLVFSFLPCVRRRVAAMVSARWRAVAMSRKTAAGPLCCYRSWYSSIARVIKDAASEGHVVCLSYLLSRHGRYDRIYEYKRKAACAAARSGRLGCLAYLAAQSGGIDNRALNAACKRGNTDSIRYLCETAGVTPHWGHFLLAITSGCLGAVDYFRVRSVGLTIYDDWFNLNVGRPYKDLHLLCVRPDACACAIAARHGHIHVLEYLIGVGCVPNAYACIEAARGGHLACLEYVHKLGTPWDTRTCAAAATGTKRETERNAEGRLACIVYARANGCPASTMPCYVAARRGDLMALRRAHEAECPWDADTIAAAAAGGHRGCVYYAREQGCPWSKRVCVLAAARGALKILAYAHRHGCPYDLDDLVVAATRGGQHRCLDYIKKYMQ